MLLPSAALPTGSTIIVPQWRDVVAVSAGCMFLCSMHRSIFSALAPTLAVRYSLTSSDIGLIQAAALGAYLVGTSVRRPLQPHHPAGGPLPHPPSPTSRPGTCREPG
jgi:hypothetical protein